MIHSLGALQVAEQGNSVVCILLSSEFVGCVESVQEFFLFLWHLGLPDLLLEAGQPHTTS